MGFNDDLPRNAVSNVVGERRGQVPIRNDWIRRWTEHIPWMGVENHVCSHDVFGRPHVDAVKSVA